MLRVGISAYELAPGRTGGTETYVRTLVRGLGAREGDEAYTVFVRPEVADALEAGGPRVTVASLADGYPLRERVRRKLGRGRTFEQLLAERIDTCELDVLHFPLSAIFPRGVRAPKVLSVMDVQHEHLPEFFEANELDARRRVYRDSIAQADHVIAISEFTRRTLVERYGVAGDRVTVVHLTHDPELFARPAGTAVTPLPERYLYYPAAAWPHKNHLRLLEALALARRDGVDVQLVLSGMAERMTDRIRRRADELGLRDTVRHLGYLPPSELPLLYRGALALVFPSLYEGFGIPLLEAMACDCPVVASDAGALPEVAGEAARYVDPRDVEAIAEAIADVARDAELRAELVRRGRERVRSFSPERMAGESASVYARAAGPLASAGGASEPAE